MKAALLAFAVRAVASGTSAWYFYAGPIGFGSGPVYYYQPAVIYNPPVYSSYPYYPYPSYYSPYQYYPAPAYYYSGTYNSYSYSYEYDYHYSGPSNVEHYHYCCYGSSCGWNC